MSKTQEILHTYLQASRHLTEKFRATYGRTDLTYPQSVVLAILESEGPMPISALAEAAGSANSTISGVVDRLEKLGLAQRIRSDNDRRVIYVSTTQQFRKLFREIDGSVTDHFTQTLSCLSEEEQDQVLQGLTLLNRALRSDETPSAR